MGAARRLVGVAVVVVVWAPTASSGGRGGAAVGGFAAADLELDGGVGDVEAVAQGAVDGVQDAGALRERHLRDGDVAGERVGGGAERPDVEVVDVEDAGDGGERGADVGELETARGVPSSRMLRVSRTMVTELQTIMPAMRSESTGSIHMMPVKRMPAPPAMTAAVESVSPSMCRKTERMLTSPENFQSRAAMAPFMRTPAAATYIIRRGWTATGA